MDGSTNAQNSPEPDLGGNPMKIKIGRKTWLCWGYVGVPFQGSTVKSVTVNLPVTSASPDTYFPMVSVAGNDAYWANIQLTAPYLTRTTASFDIQSWVLDESSITGSILAYWMAIVTTA